MDLQERLIQVRKDKAAIEAEEKKLLKEIEIFEKTYRIGNWFSVGGYKAILAQCNTGMVALIETEGNRWRNPVSVEDTREITERELNSIGAKGCDLIKVNVVRF